MGAHLLSPSPQTTHHLGVPPARQLYPICLKILAHTPTHTLTRTHARYTHAHQPSAHFAGAALCVVACLPHRSSTFHVIQSLSGLVQRTSALVDGPASGFICTAQRRTRGAVTYFRVPTKNPDPCPPDRRASPVQQIERAPPPQKGNKHLVSHCLHPVCSLPSTPHQTSSAPMETLSCSAQGPLRRTSIKCLASQRPRLHTLEADTTASVDGPRCAAGKSLQDILEEEERRRRQWQVLGPTLKLQRWYRRCASRQNVQVLLQKRRDHHRAIWLNTAAVTIQQAWRHAVHRIRDTSRR